MFGLYSISQLYFWFQVSERTSMFIQLYQVQVVFWEHVGMIVGEIKAESFSRYPESTFGVLEQL